jgi:hypothetical protein
MSVILLVLGIAVTAAGGALIGFGLPIKELASGATQVLAGTIALVGGALLIGLAVVARELARLRDTLKAPVRAPLHAIMPAARAEITAPPAETVAREPIKEVLARAASVKEALKAPEPAKPAEPAPAPPVAAPAPVLAAAASPAAEASETAIERLRSTLVRPDKVFEAEEAVPLSPSAQLAAHRVEPPPPQVEPAPRMLSAAATVETREPKLDVLFKPPRPARPAAPSQQEAAFDSLWPRRAREAQADVRLEVARGLATAGAPLAEPAAPATAPDRTVAILKSGVVDGMAYTLYADGSIEAQLPQGTVRFGSIAELRTHIESNV